MTRGFGGIALSDEQHGRSGARRRARGRGHDPARRAQGDRSSASASRAGLGWCRTSRSRRRSAAGSMTPGAIRRRRLRSAPRSRACSRRASARAVGGAELARAKGKSRGWACVNAAASTDRARTNRKLAASARFTHTPTLAALRGARRNRFELGEAACAQPARRRRPAVPLRGRECRRGAPRTQNWRDAKLHTRCGMGAVPGEQDLAGPPPTVLRLARRGSRGAASAIQPRAQIAHARSQRPGIRRRPNDVRGSSPARAYCRRNRRLPTPPPPPPLIVTAHAGVGNRRPEPNRHRPQDNRRRHKRSQTAYASAAQPARRHATGARRTRWRRQVPPTKHRCHAMLDHFHAARARLRCACPTSFSS